MLADMKPKSPAPSAKPLPVVKPNSVWIDCDKRVHSRGVRAIRVVSLTKTHAQCMVGVIEDGAFRESFQKTSIRLDRFQPTATGFKPFRGNTAPGEVP